MIPLVDLGAQYLNIKSEIDNAVNLCIEESNFIRGKQVSEFEKAFAEYVGTKFCSGCGNGTDALELILKALGIGIGDEVIVPALSWISTAEAVTSVGADPVFVDICPETYSIDPLKIEEKITSRTKAIIPVHLYGCPVELEDIKALADSYRLFIIEDCAQSHGAEYHGRKTGTFGIASAFSFFPTKNLGAFGDGGAVITDDSDLYEKVKRLSNHGQFLKKHDHPFTGRNSRLDTLQASVLNVKLSHLDNWNSKRIVAAGIYNKRLSVSGNVTLPFIPDRTKHVFHLYVIRSKRREAIIKNLEKNNVGWAIHYPLSLPLLEAYKHKHHNPDDFPVSTTTTEEILSLPMFPDLTEKQINIICDTILESL